MRKTLIILFVVMVILLFSLGTASCKKMNFKEDELVLVMLQGSGSYNSKTDTSTILLKAKFRITQPAILDKPVKMNVEKWTYTVYDGNRISLQVSSSDYKTYLGPIDANVSGWNENEIWVYLENKEIVGDLYFNTNPGVVIFSIRLADERNNYYAVEYGTNFTFTRN